MKSLIKSKEHAFSHCMKSCNSFRHPFQIFRILNWEKALAGTNMPTMGVGGGKMGETQGAAHHARVHFVNGTDFHAQPSPSPLILWDHPWLIAFQHSHPILVICNCNSMCICILVLILVILLQVMKVWIWEICSKWSECKKENLSERN